MKPGRELDAIVAEKVMGWEKFLIDQSAPYYSDEDKKRGYFWMIGTVSVGCTNNDGSPKCPRYSTNIAAAWEVVEKLRGVWDIRSMSTTWVVRLSIQVGTSDKRVGAEAETVQHAICLAALKAMEINI